MSNQGQEIRLRNISKFYEQLDAQRRVNTELFESGKLDLESMARTYPESPESITNRDYGIYEYHFHSDDGKIVRLTSTDILVLHDLTGASDFTRYNALFDDEIMPPSSWGRQQGESLRDSLIPKRLVEVTDASQNGGYRVIAKGEYTAKVVKPSG